MTPDDRQRAAEQILSIPYFRELMDELEAAAVNAILAANDHDTRQAHTCDARAVRKLRSRLEAVSKEGQLQTGRKAPA